MNDNNKKQAVSGEEKRSAEVHRLGRISGIICIAAMLCVPLFTQIFYGITIEIGALIAALLALVAFIIVGIIEVISYGPILGPGATYLAFITGNVGNMKLPAAVSGMSIAEADASTEKGKTVSTLAVGISSIVTTLVLFIGMLGLSLLLPLLNNPVLKPAMDTMIYALMGAFATPIIFKNFKGFILPGVVMSIIVLAKLPIPLFFQMPLMLLVSVAWAYLLYVLKKKKEAGSKPENNA